MALIPPASREFGPKFKAEIKVHCAGKPRTIAFWEQKLMRLLEALALKWSEIELDAANGKKLGYLFVREGKLKNARRHVSLTPRAQEILVNQSLESKSEYVFANQAGNPT